MILARSRGLARWRRFLGRCRCPIGIPRRHAFCLSAPGVRLSAFEMALTAAQPRGGPMPTVHTNHQIGLDADIWLTPMPNRMRTRQEREDITAVSMLRDPFNVDLNLWTLLHTRLIKLAASYRVVERIFQLSKLGTADLFVSPRTKRLRKTTAASAAQAVFIASHLRSAPPASSRGQIQQPIRPAWSEAAIHPERFRRRGFLMA